MKVPTDRPLYGMDQERLPLTEAQKNQHHGLAQKRCGNCGGTWERHILVHRCAHCDDCRGWKP
jgi:hypothetical protein